MNFAVIGIASFAAGIFASLGLGGGMVLIVYLTAFAGVSQLAAQGINLIFFLPIAAISLILHTKNGLVEWKKIIPAIFEGTAAAVVFSIAANRLDSFYLEKAFGIFLIITGLNEFFTAEKKNQNKKATLNNRH